jgi:hypothetical protein
MRHATVHRDHLGAFGEFLERAGAVLCQPKGDYEVMRAARPNVPPVLVYRRERGETLTVSQTGTDAVDSFYRERRGAKDLGKTRDSALTKAPVYAEVICMCGKTLTLDGGTEYIRIRDDDDDPDWKPREQRRWIYFCGEACYDVTWR